MRTKSKAFHTLQLFYCAGIGRTSNSMAKVYRYNDTSNNWDTATPLPVELSGHACASQGDYGLLCGGMNVSCLSCFFDHFYAHCRQMARFRILAIVLMGTSGR